MAGSSVEEVVEGCRRAEGRGVEIAGRHSLRLLLKDLIITVRRWWQIVIHSVLLAQIQWLAERCLAIRGI